MRALIEPNTVDELRTLYRRLPALAFDAAIALRTDAGKPLEGAGLERYRAAASKLAMIMAWIADLTAA